MAKKEDKIPEDIDSELKAPKFGKANTHTTTGYFLDVNENDKKVDLQLYEPISGTTILEGLEISKKVNLNDIEKGVIDLDHDFLKNIKNLADFKKKNLRT